MRPHVSACLTNAAGAKLEPRSERLLGEDPLWLVTFDSPQDAWGHKCRVWVNAREDNHVVRIEIWSGGAWSSRFETSYAYRGDRWLPVQGQHRSLSARPNQSVSAAAGLRFVVARAEVGSRREDAGFLPSLPVGTWVGDQRTGAGYQIGRDDHAEVAIARLVKTARSASLDVEGSRAAYLARPSELRRIAGLAAVGAALGLLTNGLGRFVWGLRKGWKAGRGTIARTGRG